uniref:hypothetical protein n=1 Tax=Psychrobacter sp. TaxID=56811 RepID=UPI00159A3ADF|nr:hypothetical protein [Psychrobacter sp.]QJS05679.1 hypothetical protein [Psychrobacter sp.]
MVTMERLQSTVFTVGAWFFGITFILIALSALLTGNFIVGLVVLIGAILLLPPVKTSILNKRNDVTRAKITLLGAALVFFPLFFLEERKETELVEAETIVQSPVNEIKDVDSDPQPIQNEAKPAPSNTKTDIAVIEQDTAKNIETVERSNANESSSDPQPSSQTLTEGATLGMSLNTFKRNFKTQTNELGLKAYNLNNIKVEQGKVNDVFTSTFGNDIAMIGSIAKNGEINSITYIMGKTDNGQKAALDLLALGAITAKALNPDLPQKNTSEVVGKLMTDAANKAKKDGEVKVTKVEGNVKYTVSVSKILGLWLIFEAVE